MKMKTKIMQVLFRTTSILLALVLSLLLASCGGSGSDSDPLGSDDKKDSTDKEGPASAPTATGPTNAVFGDSYDLSIVCNEAGEVVSITGNGIEPNPQTHTCTASGGAENFSLSLKQGARFPSPNILTLSSEDQDGNPAGSTTTVDVPIDTQTSAPTATGPSAPVGGASYNLSIVCNEVGEVVSITGNGIEPNPQTYTCTASGEPENFSLSLKQGVHFPSPNNLTLSVVNQDGNPVGSTTTVDVPIDTQTSAPTATGPSAPVGGASYNLSIVCNEAGEVVSITGNGIEPNPQTYTCTASGAENFSLSLKQEVRFPSPNDLTLSSTDQGGNPTDKTTMVDVPIDTLPWRVSIDGESLEGTTISASNAQSFTIEGTCTEDGEPVIVSVGGVSPETDPDCASNSWSVDIDVTGLNKTAGAISITADHSSSNGDKATQALGSVTNSFICPANFVGVPSLTGYTTHSFCVMKYEAKKNSSNNAISQAAGKPYRDINRDESITKCQNMGTGYDLITNDEWQSIARNIELVGSNWKNGTVRNQGGLSVGHSDYSPQNALAANSDDNEACHATGDVCDGSTWHSQRRTHTLSNGEVIWDMSGNVGEWVKDINAVEYGPNSSMSKVTDVTHPTAGSFSEGTTTTSRTAKGHFGPSGDYTHFISAPLGGLGYGQLNRDFGGVIRGGDYEATSPGVFSVNLGSPKSLDNPFFLGFRCVYHPPAPVTTEL